MIRCGSMNIETFKHDIHNEFDYYGCQRKAARFIFDE